MNTVECLCTSITGISAPVSHSVSVGRCFSGREAGRRVEGEREDGGREREGEGEEEGK